MAIVGFLAHAEPGKSGAVEVAIAQLPGMTTYGIHNDDYVVAVAEVDSGQLEEAFGDVHRLEGILATYVTSLTTEDEEEPSRE